MTTSESTRPSASGSRTTAPETVSSVRCARSHGRSAGRASSSVSARSQPKDAASRFARLSGSSPTISAKELFASTIAPERSRTSSPSAIVSSAVRTRDGTAPADISASPTMRPRNSQKMANVAEPRTRSVFATGDVRNPHSPSALTGAKRNSRAAQGVFGSSANTSTRTWRSVWADWAASHAAWSPEDMRTRPSPRRRATDSRSGLPPRRDCMAAPRSSMSPPARATSEAVTAAPQYSPRSRSRTAASSGKCPVAAIRTITLLTIDVSPAAIRARGDSRCIGEKRAREPAARVAAPAIARSGLTR